MKPAGQAQACLRHQRTRVSWRVCRGLPRRRGSIHECRTIAHRSPPDVVIGGIVCGNIVASLAERFVLEFQWLADGFAAASTSAGSGRGWNSAWPPGSSTICNLPSWRSVRVGPVELRLVALSPACVLHFERAAALQLNAIVEDGSGRQRVRSKAGAGIVDFKELNRRASAVFDCRVDVIGVAAGGGGQHAPQ